MADLLAMVLSVVEGALERKDLAGLRGLEVVALGEGGFLLLKIALMLGPSFISYDKSDAGR